MISQWLHFYELKDIVNLGLERQYKESTQEKMTPVSNHETLFMGRK